MEWKNIYRGILMGVSDLIPGVSGSTIAVILGFYDRLLEAISTFFSRSWKKSLPFLIPLGVGVVITLLVFSRVIHFLLEAYPQPTQFLFAGLIIGVLPLLVRKAKVTTEFSSKHWIALGIGLIVVASMAFLPEKEFSIENLTIGSTVYLFISGWMASMAMLLPGISGSFVLLVLGAYSIALEALSTLNLPIIAVIGAGVMIGFVVSSKVIKYLIQHYFTLTYAVIIGLVIGSLFTVFPGVPTSIGLIVASIITFCVGLLTVLYLSKKDTSQ